MKTFFILLTIIFLSAGTAFAQTSSCYELTRSKGIAAYNAGNYDRAIEYFKLSLNTCEDTPRNNDLQTWINKCKTLKELNIEMVHIQGGTYSNTMFDDPYDDTDDEQNTFLITLDEFNLGKYEITQKQWTTIMDYNPSYFRGDNLPVENVGWQEVMRFIDKLNVLSNKHYRLPTAAEWYYVWERNGYYPVNEETNNPSEWNEDNSEFKTHPVGTKLPNQSGLYDFTGNVWEWSSDKNGKYQTKRMSNPRITSGTYRLICGTAYDGCTECDREPIGQVEFNYKGKDTGFRLALDSK